MNPTSTQYNYQSPSGGDTSLKGFNPNLSSTFGTQNQNSQNFTGGQLGTQQAFQGANQSAVNALPTFQQLNENANRQYNVPNLQNTATQLNNQVLQIPQTYSQATQGSDTNNNQLMQLIGQKQWELAPLAQAATNSAQTAQGLANTSVGYGVQNEAQLLSPFTNAAPMVQSILSGASSNFGTAQQAELAALTAKMQSGVTLTTDEADNLRALQVAQTQAEATKAAANAAAQASMYSSNLAAQNQQIGQGSTYYNPTTGAYYNPTTRVSAPA